MAGIWKIVSKSKAIWSFTNETTTMFTPKKTKKWKIVTQRRLDNLLLKKNSNNYNDICNVLWKTQIKKSCIVVTLVLTLEQMRKSWEKLHKSSFDTISISFSIRHFSNNLRLENRLDFKNLKKFSVWFFVSDQDCCGKGKDSQLNISVL
jgi:hypothetical protein